MAQYCHTRPVATCASCIEGVMRTAFQIAPRFTRSIEDANDVVGDLMVHVVETGLRDYDPTRGPLEAWLTTVLRSRATTYYRSEIRRTAREERSGLTSPSADSPRYCEAEMQIVVDAVLERSSAPAAHQAAVRLKLEGHTYAEIAEDMAAMAGIERSPARWGQIARPILAEIREELDLRSVI